MPDVADAALRRLLDVTVAGMLLLVLAPLLGLLALLVRATSRGPALFREIRIGRNARPRPAEAAHDARRRAGPVIRPGAPGLTHLGAWLRRTKLDELPQLWNVLRGDMSLVGPRPEVPHYVALYTAAQRAVLLARPGLTDPASLAWADEAARLARFAEPDRAYADVAPGKLASAWRTSSDAPSGAISWSMRIVGHLASPAAGAAPSDPHEGRGHRGRVPAPPRSRVDRVNVRRVRALSARAPVVAVVPTPWAPPGLAGPPLGGLRPRHPAARRSRRKAVLSPLSSGSGMDRGRVSRWQSARPASSVAAPAGRCDAACETSPEGRQPWGSGWWIERPAARLGRGTDVHGLPVPP
jgi:lipopolysaccharide/colanic/teichoic acid biosynthesis glycosyltransferase